MLPAAHHNVFLYLRLPTYRSLFSYYERFTGVIIIGRESFGMDVSQHERAKEGQEMND